MSASVQAGFPLRWPDAWALIVLGLLARLPLLLEYPAVHGGDPVLRLARSEELLIAYWLPLPQLVVYLTRALAPDPCWTRTVFALVGALAAPALAWVVATTAGAGAGRAAGVLVSLHPLLVYYSIVPYQEVVAIPLLLVAAAALLRGRELLGSLALGLACLCRYEAWIGAALAGFARRRSPLRAVALFGWAPIGWMLARGGLAPPGSYVFDLDMSADRLQRVAFLLGKLREYAGDPVLWLAALGAFAAWRRGLRAWAWGGVFLALYLAAQTAVGHEYPPGSGHVSERVAQVPAVAACALAGLALGAAGDFAMRRQLGLVVSLASSVLAAWLGLGWSSRTRALVAAANQDPSLRLAFSVARMADRRLSPTGQIAVAGPQAPPAAVSDYLRKVEASGGDVERARVLAQQANAPDAARIRAHLARPPSRVIQAGAGPAELIVVFDDAPERARFATGAIVARFVEGARGVTLYRPRDPPNGH